MIYVCQNHYAICIMHALTEIVILCMCIFISDFNKDVVFPKSSIEVIICII